MLWANLHLLFWLSLTPFVTGWMGENHFAADSGRPLWHRPPDVRGRLLHPRPRAARREGQEPTLARAIGSDFKGRISVVVYLVAIALSFVYAPASMALYVAVAIMWFVPDRRIERTIRE